MMPENSNALHGEIMTTITPELLKRAFGSFPTGITIVTASTASNNPVGFTASSFTSVSLDPPLLLICIDHRSDNLDVFRSATHFGVNVLAENQADLSSRFATEIEDRFDGVAWSASTHGTPMIDHALSSFDCALEAIHTAGDHDILIGRIVGLETKEGPALGYFRGKYGRFNEI